jgi:hypothetical protein
MKENKRKEKKRNRNKTEELKRKQQTATTFTKLEPLMSNDIISTQHVL